MSKEESRILAEQIVEAVDEESNDYDAIEAVQSILAESKFKETKDNFDHIINKNKL